ncbi:MAG: NAD(P)/FAD-dependent oxidoreductase, partial [Tissierellales bacterium]|nr:NAD(P)/FAD-dependent oxidoreductase [Tissierellales bacterium]
HAQVTAGGIDTRDINPNTMESKLIKGLYITGEIMDVDGDCGGYNLHWAWSTGYTAGRSL